MSLDGHADIIEDELPYEELTGVRVGQVMREKTPVLGVKVWKAPIWRNGGKDASPGDVETNVGQAKTKSEVPKRQGRNRRR